MSGILTFSHLQIWGISHDEAWTIWRQFPFKCWTGNIEQGFILVLHLDGLVGSICKLNWIETKKNLSEIRLI